MFSIVDAEIDRCAELGGVDPVQRMEEGVAAVLAAIPLAHQLNRHEPAVVRQVDDFLRMLAVADEALATTARA